MTHPLASNLLIIAEEVASVRASENYLSDFCEMWALLSPEAQPPALRRAKEALVIAALNDPLQSEIRFNEVAAAAGISKSELRRQIQQRARFYFEFHQLCKQHPEESKDTLCKLILV
jgi:hypothetical protein